jgi:hypothetical protein
MVISVDEREQKVINVTESGNELQVVAEYYPAFKENSILVFKMESGEEVLGVINDTDDNELHTLMYVEINPNQTDNFNIKQIQSILLWGAL